MSHVSAMQDNVQVRLLLNFFKRNNPVEAMLMQGAQMLYWTVTFNSRRKVQKYKFLLEVEKLEKMQKSLYEAPDYQANVKTMNRVY